MRKLMALCLSLLMVLSMCSFTAMAAEVDFAEIANGQPVNFVTEDLVLSGHSITSSDTAVIAEDGTVTRPLFEDATVQVAIDGGEAVDVTVKAQTVDVKLYQDYSIEGDNYGWNIKVPGENTPSAVANGVFNIVIGPTHVEGVNQGRTNIVRALPEASGTRPVVIQFDSDNFTNVVIGADIRVDGKWYDAEGEDVGSFTAVTAARGNANGWAEYWMAGGRKKSGVTIKYDPTTGEIWGNGKLYEERNLLGTYDKDKTAPENAAKVVLTSMTFCNAADNCTATFDIDNLVVYEEVPEEEVLANATPAQQALYYSKYLAEAYVANGGNLDALTTNLKFEADEELPADVNITWKSSDEAVIAADGTVTRPFFVEQTVTITGTVKVDGADDIVKTYTAKVLPLTILGQSEIVDFDTAGSVEDFKLDSNTTSSAVNEAGNNVGAFTFTGTNTITLASCYSFDKLPSIANAKELVMSFKLRTQNHSEEGTGNVTNYGFRVNGSEIAEFINYGGYIRVNNTYNGADATNGWHGLNPANVNYNTNSDNYAEFKIIVDLAEKTAKHCLNDTPIGTASVGIGLASLDSITSMDFYISDRVSGSTVYVDDIYVHTTQSLDSAVSTLSDADKVSFFKELIGTTEFADVTAGQTLALDSTYASYDLDELGVSITWESNNDAYISNNGQVKKLAEFGTNVTVDMTATITAGTESDTSTIEVEIDDSTELVKTVDFTDTTMDIGSKATYVTDDVVHGNVIYMKHTQDEINENEEIWLANGKKGANPYHKTSSTIAAVSGGGRGDRLVVEADVKYVHGDAEGAFGALGVMTYAGKKGMQVGLNYKTGSVTLQTTATTVDPSASSLSVSDNKTVTFPMPESVLQKGEGEWVHITIDHNALSQTYSVYIDGQLVNEVPVLQAQMALVDSSQGLSIPGSAIRGISIELSQTGEMWVDNVSLKKYSNTDAVEVNAALNAALVEYASKEYRTVLTNRDLAPMTIGKSWINDNKYDRDIIVTQTDPWGAKYKVENPSTYKFVEDGPALTYEINGEVVNAINVDHAGIVNLTITAKANGIEESKTVARKVAPVAIRGLALGTADCLNGLWLEGATGNEKVVVVQCLENGAPAYSYTPATDEEEAFEWFGTHVFDLAAITNAEGDESYNPETGIMKGISGVNHPRDSQTIEKVKIFVFGENGITPVAHNDIILE